MSGKIPIYLVPGMGANSKIYERIRFDEERYERHFLEWFPPLSVDESIASYAERMSLQIRHKNPVLIGVSFGGILVQEMRKYTAPRKVIVISSLRSCREFPRYVTYIRKTKIHRLLTEKRMEKLLSYFFSFLHRSQKKKVSIYEKYMTARNPLYLRWAVSRFLYWQQKEIPEEVLHIHGTKDRLFPIKHIHSCVAIQGGTHWMIVTKAEEITEVLKNNLICL